MVVVAIPIVYDQCLRFIMLLIRLGSRWLHDNSGPTRNILSLDSTGFVDRGMVLSEWPSELVVYLHVESRSLLVILSQNWIKLNVRSLVEIHIDR